MCKVEIWVEDRRCRCLRHDAITAYVSAGKLAHTRSLRMSQNPNKGGPLCLDDIIVVLVLVVGPNRGGYERVQSLAYVQKHPCWLPMRVELVNEA